MLESCLPEAHSASQSGLVYRCSHNENMAVATGPRSVLLNNGDLLCTFMVQSELGVNDFKPMICRSTDEGRTWNDHELIWPELGSEWSIFGSISRDNQGVVFFYGSRTPIDKPGELFWQSSNNGIKQNELIWSRSFDDGITWAIPQLIPLPIPGSAEAPGPMCITRSGRWVCCYAPYNTFDQNLSVDRNQVIVLTSDDQGNTWSHTSMMRFNHVNSGGAEAWVIQLSDGRLLGTCWHINHDPDGEDLPNAYSISHDEGSTWTETHSTSIFGQATALVSLPEGKAIFVYNDRKLRPAGVRIAEIQPTEKSIAASAKKLAWSAPQPSQNGFGTDFESWTDFSFGEPSATLLNDGTLLVCFWCIHAEGRDIQYVRLAW